MKKDYSGFGFILLGAALIFSWGMTEHFEGNMIPESRSELICFVFCILVGMIGLYLIIDRPKNAE